MKTSYKLFMIISCLFLFSAGCAARNEAKNFLPLNPGVTWYYDVDIQGEKVEMQVQVGEQKEVEGKLAYPLSYSYHQQALPTQIEYYAVEDKTIMFPRIDNVQGQFAKKPSQVFLKFPLKKGDKWEWSGKLLPLGKKEAVATGTVQAVVQEAETVSTPAQTYKNALRISFTSVFTTQGTNFGIKEDRWYVNKIGMVKEVVYDEKGEQVLIAVLHKIKK
ncbi:hypothetical protein [Candidatus Formimonas warabiya]|nr:hypothetical protein [Candidatus Formimonas warabiya]